MTKMQVGEAIDRSNAESKEYSREEYEAARAEVEVNSCPVCRVDRRLALHAQGCPEIKAERVYFDDRLPSAWVR